VKTNRTYKDIFVSDISYDVSEEELRQLFSLCGTVRSIQLLNDSQGNFKGIAFIRMASEKETKEAINMLDGTLLQNRCISVSLARSKEERAAAPVEIQGQKPRRRRPPKGRRKIG
jgi:RNA recognition motif-containing protein